MTEEVNEGLGICEIVAVLYMTLPSAVEYLCGWDLRVVNVITTLLCHEMIAKRNSHHRLQRQCAIRAFR